MKKAHHRFVLSLALFAAACAAGPGPASPWRVNDQCVHVFSAGGAKVAEVPIRGDGSTLLEVLRGLDGVVLDRTKVVVLRPCAEPLTIAIDVGAMHRTGDTTSNFFLRAGDVIAIAD